MKKSKLLQKTIKRLVEASFKDGKILESQVIKSIKILKSLSKPEAIWTLTEYLKLLKKSERAYTMYLETSIPLSPNQVNKARKVVEKKHQITKVITQVNPQILGGFKLRVGDEVWDETLLNKIYQVKEVISGRFNQTN